MDDDGKIAAYKKALEDDNKADAETAKLFNPKELATRNRQLLEKVHPHFGRVRYGKITMEELDEINAELEKQGQKGSRTLQTLMFLWKMLQKGCPELTLEDVRVGYSFDEVSELIVFLTSDSFFQKPKT